MCNACGFQCCAYDGFSGCGCDGCPNPDCWSEDDDFYCDSEDDWDDAGEAEGRHDLVAAEQKRREASAGGPDA